MTLLNLLIAALAVAMFLLVVYLKKRIVELENTNAELEALAICDSLTGLYTRRFMNDRLLSVECEAVRFGFHDVFVLFIDIDHFKAVNDKYGHDTGDQVLKLVAKIVRAELRVNDVAGRWGGEEVVVIGRGNAEIVAERIRRSIETVTTETPVTVSVGYAVFKADASETLASVVKRADEAMYKAKEAGRNRVCRG